MANSLALRNDTRWAYNETVIRKIATILRMIKFSHSVFALPFAIMAFFLAGNAGTPGFPGWDRLALIVWCMVWARSVAMTFNRIADARLDARNPRTADRAIPAGQLSIKQAYLFLYISAFLFAAGTFLFWRPIGLSSTGPRWFGYGNYWPVWLSLPTLLFICLYSYTKRFTWASHFWLGASLMLAPVGTWVAVSPPIGPVISSTALILGFAVLLWTAGFDIIYACQDVTVDRRDGLYSIPAKLGLTTALWISRTCHSLAITFLLLLALKVDLGGIYLTAVLITAVLLVAEHILVWKGKMTHIKIAFGTLNALISLILAAATICDII
jgi:4-hydroxybenzoate polyprenyltransferase